jgi:hypothetical protein
MAGAFGRFRALIADVPPGALHDRLVALVPDLERAVARAHDIARRAQAASSVAETFDVGQATTALKDARRRLEQLRAHDRADVGELEAEVERLAARHAAVNRALNAVDDADTRLAGLGLRLETAVAEAALLVMRPSDTGELDRLDAELGHVHDSLSALGDAFAELDR